MARRVTYEDEFDDYSYEYDGLAEEYEEELANEDPFVSWMVGNEVYLRQVFSVMGVQLEKIPGVMVPDTATNLQHFAEYIYFSFNNS